MFKRSKFSEKPELQSVSRPLQVCPSVPSLVFAVLFVPFFHVFKSLFKCFTPSGDGFHCLNKFHDTAPLTLFGRLRS